MAGESSGARRTALWRRRRERPGEGPDAPARARVEASRARVADLCRAAVEELVAAGAPHDVTHATLRRVAIGADVLTVHGAGWDVARYVLWPDGTLREAGERFGWVDESTGEVRLRSDAAFQLARDGAAAAARGGVWKTCEVVPHLDVGAVGERTGVVVADDGVSRWADHPHPAAGRRRRGALRERSAAEWPDLTEDLRARVRRRADAARGASGAAGG